MRRGSPRSPLASAAPGGVLYRMGRPSRLRTFFGAMAASITTIVVQCGCLGNCLLASSNRDTTPPRTPQPTPGNMLEMLRSETIAGSGLRQAGYMIWGGSVIRSNEDGLFNMFVSRWKERLGHLAWVTSSEVAHFVSDSPLGPWRFCDVALPRRGPHYWDGLATHNPTIHWHPILREYALFYIGTTLHDVSPPDDVAFTNRTLYELAWNSKRVGVATSKSLDGPWHRLEAPILSPRAGQWDGGITSNPAALIYPDGKVLLIYKSIIAGYPARNAIKPAPVFHLGAATATSVLGPYTRVGESPVFTVNGKPLAAEDPYIWRCAVSGRLHLIYKAMQPVRTPKPENRMVVPGGWLAYTYTEEGGDMSTWAPPQLAFNRTLVVKDDPSAFLAGKSNHQRPWWRFWTTLADSRRPVALPAVELHLPNSASSGSSASARISEELTADRLERPQLLLSADTTTPTHCFASMMLNGNSANVVLRLGVPGTSRAASPVAASPIRAGTVASRQMRLERRRSRRRATKLDQDGND